MGLWPHHGVLAGFLGAFGWGKTTTRLHLAAHERLGASLQASNHPDLSVRRLDRALVLRRIRDS